MVKGKSRPVRRTGARLPGADRRLALLGRTARVFQSSLNPRVVLKLALTDLVGLVGATSGSLVLVNPETQRLEIEAAVGLTPRARRLKLRMGEGVTGWVAAHGQPLRIGNVRQDPRYVVASPDIHSELAVPLVAVARPRALRRPDPALPVIGVLNVDSIHPDAFSAADEELLLALAGQMSGLLQNAWLYEQARRRTGQLHQLLRLGRGIMAGETVEEVLDLAARGAAGLFPGSLGAVLLLEPDGERLAWRADSSSGRRQKRSLIPVEDSLIGMAARRREPVTIDDIRHSDPFAVAALRRHPRLTSFLGAPLLVGTRALGVLALFTRHPQRFTDDQLQAVGVLAGQVALTLQRLDLTRRLLVAEEQLRHSERLSAVGLLAAEVAHEIRNPLTVIKMLTHHLGADIPRKDPRRRDFEVLGRKFDQMNRTVERVLGLARGSEPSFSVQPVNPMVEELVLLLRHKLAQQRIRLKWTPAHNLPPVRMDRGQMEQALLNVALNALHAMPRGGTLELRTGTELAKPPEETSAVWIEIRDSGIGMTPRQQQTLFEPFLTSRQKGTGLGMAIVSRILKVHGGRITVRSRLHHGTTLRLALPSA